jgi:hypothetical protein
MCNRKFGMYGAPVCRPLQVCAAESFWYFQRLGAVNASPKEARCTTETQWNGMFAGRSGGAI